MRIYLLPLAIAISSMGCAGTDSSESRPSNMPSAGSPAFDPTGDHARAVVRTGDGSVRVPFLGGSFVSYNTEMPIEVEQAVQGKRTSRPVVVWAGNEAGIDRSGDGDRMNGIGDRMNGIGDRGAPRR